MQFIRQGDWVKIQDDPRQWEVVHVQIDYQVWRYQTKHKVIYRLVKIDIDEYELLKQINPGKTSVQLIIKELLGELYSEIF